MSNPNLAKNKTARRPAGAGSTKRARQRPARRKGAGEITNCKSEVELIADYLTRRLSPAVQRSFERHMTGCSDCAAFLNTYKRTITLTRSFLGQQAPKPKLRFTDLRAAGLVR